MKKKSALLLFLLFVCIGSFAQNFEMYKGDTINVKDSQEQKQGRWVIFNKGGTFPGFAEGQVVEDGNYLNGKKVGIWKRFYPNGKLKSELAFANNMPSGSAKFYYESGRIQEEGNWKDRKWVGNYKYYHENGVLYYDWEFNTEGKREGKQKYYYTNGNPMYQGEWHEGKEMGLLKEFYENGSLKAEKYFNDGKLDPGNTKNFDLGNPVDHPKPPIGYIQPELIAKVEKEVAKELGSIPDGQFTTYYKGDKGKVDKDGVFKNKVLIEGKQNIYDGSGKLIKTNTIRGGKIVDTKTIK